MIVDELDLFGACVGPDEADAPAVVYTDRMLPGPIAEQRLEPAARRNAQVVEPSRGIEHFQLAPRHLEHVRGIAFRSRPRKRASVAGSRNDRIISSLVTGLYVSLNDTEGKAFVSLADTLGEVSSVSSVPQTGAFSEIFAAPGSESSRGSGLDLEISGFSNFSGYGLPNPISRLVLFPARQLDHLRLYPVHAPLD